MILIVTQSYYANAGFLIRFLSQMEENAFRFNIDLFDAYRFDWQADRFTITDPLERSVKSEEITAVVIYRGLMHIDDVCEWDSRYESPEMIRSALNVISNMIARWAINHDVLKLFTPYEMLYPKTHQMQIAEEFFVVPEFHIHWGFTLPSKTVVVKPLTARSPNRSSCLYARKVDRANLAPEYPWFTQEIASGDFDATVVYINGRCHCFKFAAPRGDLTDWRITQGTDLNRWETWDAGSDFEEKVKRFMEKMRLKYGRLDFIIGGKEPQFLEVNPCGQFGWLENDTFTMHREAAEAIISPSSIITQ